MPRRDVPARPVELLHDGEVLQAQAGEPLAHALIAAGRLVLARSPKLHRPRGPYCLRGACDGCLVRVDGTPNVPACRTRVRGGENVETQNVLGTREVDLLGATDFLFPHGIDAHRLFTSVRGASGMVTRFARRIAGLGKLPDVARAPVAAERRDVDVVVVGGGATGLALAARLGPRATLVDDALELGGLARLLDPAGAPVRLAAARAAGAELLDETSAVGAYREPDDGTNRLTLLCAGKGRARLLRARVLVLATGCHDAVPEFPGGDLPGISSARAGLELEQAGIVPDSRVVLVGSGRSSEALAARLGRYLVLRVPHPETVERTLGKLTLRGLVLREHGGSRRIRAGGLFYDGTPSPAFELAVQAGGAVQFRSGIGYVPALDAVGRAAPGVYCAGSVTAEPARDVSAVVTAVHAELGA